VDERSRLINQSHCTLKTYYPLAEAILGSEMNTLMAAEFLARWPDLHSVQAASPDTLGRFFYKHNCRSSRKLDQRLQAIKNARPLTSDPAIIEPARALVSARAAMLRSLNQSIAALDQQIQQAMDQHPDAAIFRSLPGAGPALAPRLLSAFGTQRDRFESADEVAQFYGIAPVVIESGNSQVVRMRYRCPKFGRQTFHENAACVAKIEPWAKAYYRQHRQKHDDKHHQACRALAYKLIRIYFACWKNRTEYRTQNYLAALQRSGSHLSRALKNSAGE
jgi:transposase